MKILGINSSARKDGNTAILMEKAFEALHKEGIETEMIQLSGKIIEPCKACFACDGQRNCVHKKDQFQDIFEKMTQADGIILGSPGLYGKHFCEYAGAVGARFRSDRYEPKRKIVSA